MNNKLYLRYFPLAFCCALLYGVLAFFISANDYFKDQSINYPVYIAGQTNFALFYLLAIRCVFKDWKTAWICFFATLLTGALDMLYWHHQMPFNSSSQDRELATILFETAHPLLSAIPILVVLGMSGNWKRKKGLLVIIAAYIFMKGVLPSWYVGNGLAAIFKWEEISNNGMIVGHVYTRLINALRHMVFGLADIIFIAGFLLYLQKSNTSIKTKWLNFDNNGGTTGTLLAWWTVKTTIHFTILGVVLVVYFGFDLWYNISKTIGYYRQVDGILLILSGIIIILAGAWYLRKLTTELLISRGIKHKFLYWLTTLPIIGLITWLILIAATKTQKTYEAKKEALHQLQASPSMAVTFLTLLMYLGAIIISVPGSLLIAVWLLASLVLYCWFIYSEKGYWFSLGINFLLTLFIIGFITVRCLGGEDHSFTDVIKNWGIALAAILLGTLQLVWLYPVYHLDRFEYTPVDTSATIALTGDLFTDQFDTTDQ